MYVFCYLCFPIPSPLPALLNGSVFSSSFAKAFLHSQFQPMPRVDLPVYDPVRLHVHHLEAGAAGAVPQALLGDDDAQLGARGPVQAEASDVAARRHRRQL